MYNLTQPSLSDMTHASARLRKLGEGARSMEEAGARITRFVYDDFGDPVSGERGCVLVRLYRTHRFGQLPPELQGFARGVDASATIGDEVRCFVLLASAGLEPEWNSRQSSSGHRAIPITSPEALNRLPMVSALMSQLGVDLGSMFRPGSLLLTEDGQKSFNVFHVPEAKGSPHIPAQAGFVEKYAVRSVLGCGGQLPDGELYSLILFSRLEIGRDTAAVFKPLTLAIKLALLPFSSGAIFDEVPR